jgi:glutamate/tyrosine decarboxylase-like PLP-dependent enzyme
MFTQTIAKQMIDVHKTTFENSFKTMVAMQDQAEGMVNTWLEQAPWMPQEGKQVLGQWVAACKKGRDGYRQMVDESFEKAQDLFSSTAPQTKAKKSS